METIGVTKKRFLILIIYCLFAATNQFQWIQYSIISDTVSSYYNVPEMAITFTSVVYMISYIPLIFPAAWFLDKYGLRQALILGSLLNFLGATIKCFSLKPNLFWVAFVGQTLSAISQVMVLNIPPVLAAIWFPNSELSRATSVGFFGSFLGVLLGFIVPPSMVKESQSINRTTLQMEYMIIGTAIVTAMVFILIICFLEDKPATPPSYAQIKGLSRQSSFATSLKTMFTNRHFVLLFISYGLCNGATNSLATILSPVVNKEFPNHDTEAGFLGTLSLIAGIVGAAVGGLCLDKLRWYKSITVTYYAMTVLGFALYGLLLKTKVLWTLYPISIFLGFFTNGYLPIAFEFAAEITYPEPEGTSTGMLMVSSQILGIFLTLIGSAMVEPFGGSWSCWTLATILLIGLVLTIFTKADLKRQRAESEGQNNSPNSSGLEPESLHVHE
ncbi:putative MFS-type transporter -like protein [Halotydeus destructor]|nr:putative MFS-type transporter -like protein [Halotydeus destructor]